MEGTSGGLVSSLLKTNLTSKLDQVSWTLSKQVLYISKDGDSVKFLSKLQRLTTPLWKCFSLFPIGIYLAAAWLWLLVIYCTQPWGIWLSLLYVWSSERLQLNRPFAFSSVCTNPFPSPSAYVFQSLIYHYGGLLSSLQFVSLSSGTKQS